MADLQESRQTDLVVLCTVMLIIAIVAVVLRFWSNHISPAHHFGYDDLFALLALPCIVIESALIYWWIHLGLGRHAEVVPPEQLLQGPKIIFIAAFFYDGAITFPKFSVLFFYHRIFERTSDWFHYALWIVGGMNASWLVSAWISTIFQCVPVQASWDPAFQEGARCFGQRVWFLGTAIPSMIIDLMILIMPLPLLWDLHATWKRRAVVSGIFVCGYCVIVVSLGRLISLVKAGDGLLDDLTYSTIPYIMWVQCEGPISVMSVSLPNIVFLVRRLSERGTKDDGTPSQSLESSCNSRSADSRKFIRLEPYRGQGLGNDTLVSSRGQDSDYEGNDVNITHEVNITKHRRHQLV